MATKKNEKNISKKDISNTSAKETFRNKVIRLLRDERTRFVGGLILLFFSIFLTISFISFFFDGAADQSIIDHQSIKEINRIGNGIQNWAGSQGAICADFFINRWIGISAFFIAIFLARLGLKLMNVITMSISRSLAYTCALIIICSLTFGFFFKHVYEDSYLFLGGYHGYYATLWLEASVGRGLYSLFSPVFYCYLSRSAVAPLPYCDIYSAWISFDGIKKEHLLLKS